MNRCKAFLTALNDRGCGAALIHRPENIRWLTGYTGEGCVFVSENAQIVVTDFRYVEQAGRQAPECDCRRTGSGVAESAVVRELCQAQGVKRLCVETDYLTHDEYLALEKALEGVELIPCPSCLRSCASSRTRARSNPFRRPRPFPAGPSTICWAKFIRA